MRWHVASAFRHVASAFRRTGSDRGVALVETALTLPLVLLITIAAVEFGRAYQTWQVLTNAAREGARIAVLPGVTDDVVRQRARTYMASGQLPAAADATITVKRDNPLRTGPMSSTTASSVTVNYPFKFIVLQPVAQLVVRGSAVGAPLTMSASTLMRNE